ALPPRAARPRSRAASTEGLSVRLRAVRAAARVLLDVPRPRAHPPSDAVLHPAAGCGALPVRRAPADDGAAGTVRVVANGHDGARGRGGHAAALHRPAAPRIRAVDATARALLSLRRDDARALVLERDRLPGV